MEKINSEGDSKAKFVPKGYTGSEYIAVGQIVPPPVPTHTVYYA